MRVKERSIVRQQQVSLHTRPLLEKLHHPKPPPENQIVIHDRREQTLSYEWKF